MGCDTGHVQIVVSDSDDVTVFVEFSGFEPDELHGHAEGGGVFLSLTAAAAACVAFDDPELDPVWDSAEAAEGPTVFPDGEGVVLFGFGGLASLPGKSAMEMDASHARTLRDQLRGHCHGQRREPSDG